MGKEIKYFPEILMIRFAILFILLINLHQSLAIDFTTLNTAYRYDPNALIRVKHRITEVGGNLEVFVSLKADSISKWQIEYLMQDDLEDPDHKVFDHELDTIHTEADLMILRLKLSNPGKKVLVVKAYDFSKYYYFDLSIVNDQYPSFYPASETGLPSLEVFADFSEVSQVGLADSAKLYAFQYLENFPPADPPMGQMGALAPSLEIDSVMMFEDSVARLNNYHFYYIQQDTNSFVGYTLLKCPVYFPEYRRLQELIAPLRYITSQKEYKVVESGGKKAFDDFWIRTYSTKQLAVSAIRSYYNRVEQSNIFFTNYKQGWKTDQGMIYIVFGPPREVYRGPRTERWVYGDGSEFTFTRISTLFTDALYTLIRNRAYEEKWFTQIARIRNNK